MKSPFYNKYFITGIVLELAALILYWPVTGYFYYSAGWPFVQILFASIYMVGGYCIFKSGLSRLWKFVLVYWWVAVILIWVLVSVIGYEIEAARYKQEIYLVPEGYHGKVILYYNQSAGDLPTYEGNKVVFRITENGVGRTTFIRRKNRFYPNYFDPTVYYVNEQGDRVPIKLAGNPTIKEDEVFVSIGGGDENAKERFNNDFLLFTASELDAYYKNYNSK